MEGTLSEEDIEEKSSSWHDVDVGRKTVIDPGAR